MSRLSSRAADPPSFGDTAEGLSPEAGGLWHGGCAAGIATGCWLHATSDDAIGGLCGCPGAAQGLRLCSSAGDTARGRKLCSGAANTAGGVRPFSGAADTAGVLRLCSGASDTVGWLKLFSCTDTAGGQKLLSGAADTAGGVRLCCAAADTAGALSGGAGTARSGVASNTAGGLSPSSPLCSSSAIGSSAPVGRTEPAGESTVAAGSGQCRGGETDASSWTGVVWASGACATAVEAGDATGGDAPFNVPRPAATVGEAPGCPEIGAATLAAGAWATGDSSAAANWASIGASSRAAPVQHARAYAGRRPTPYPSPPAALVSRAPAPFCTWLRWRAGWKCPQSNDHWGRPPTRGSAGSRGSLVSPSPAIPLETSRGVRSGLRRARQRWRRPRRLR
eukprot:scaffold10393_cov114-Isochrysis_galbana.AAC.4